MYIIGIDGGGTKTVGLLTTRTGDLLAKVELGPANYHVVGEAETQAVLEAVVAELYKRAGVSPQNVVRFCLGMAGLGRSADRQVIGRVCDAIGIPADRILTHDAHIALVGGLEKQAGVIVISGTGAIAYGINAENKEARASGWGYLLGDEGSGYDIAIKGLRAVARAADGRGEPTELTDRLLSELGMTEPAALVSWVHAASRDTIAQLAKVVFAGALGADRVAGDIVDTAAAELVSAAVSVVKQLGFAGSFDVVLSGGNFLHQAAFVDKFRHRFAEIHPGASVQLPNREPAYGAVLLARAGV